MVETLDQLVPRMKKIVYGYKHSPVEKSEDFAANAVITRKTFGNGLANKLDALTEALGHPASMTALLSGKSDIDAHFIAAPLM